MLKIFVLSNSRSGTSFLTGIFKKNIKDCTSIHEPYLDPLNPTLFGKPIYLNAIGDDNSIRPYLARKKRRIEKFSTSVYFESSHAFLKSANRLAIEYFTNVKLIHLIRNPLKMAKSAANREILTNRYYIPFRNYRADDGKLYFRWSLTGKEPIFISFKYDQLTPFQRYVIEWIEIENRAMRFLDENYMRNNCFTIHVPDELNDKKIVKEMIRFLELKTHNNDIVLKVRQNKTPGNITIISDQDKYEFQKVMEKLPGSYLAIFKKPPYSMVSWVGLLQKTF